ncbi:ABC transporter permease [Aneurinibacillus uraniidurans]|uniref:ABC transporter permease n=1 Tax=Aneurinibacillus uraniidurans TaxID=2966586 RepID=UPI0023495AE3|nr:ABC transporter permease [Aneurinibacillus sp. B1]WCN39263.1 ABC transporter permease [Aneurinibacillus sp. B1]
MSLIETIRSVLLNIQANKFRVFLTSLGIIIGTLTIVLVVAIGKGSEQAVSEQFKRLSVETIVIRPGRDAPPNSELTKEQAFKMKELEHVRDVSAAIRSQSQVNYRSTSESASIMGISESYALMNNLALETGSMFSDRDGEKRNKVALLGYTLAQTLFGEDVSEAIGKQITIKGRKYEVKGVLKRVGDTGPGGGPGGGSTDDSVFVPYDVAVKYTAGKQSKPNYTAQATDINSVAAAMQEMQTYIENTTGKTDAYTLMDAGSRLNSAKETARTMSALLIGVAGIVLLVGGIGIMNVLFVSVKERTREIGILKSIGAKRRDILLEFLLESILISFGGGIVGIVLSMIVMPLMAYTSIRVLSSAQGMLLGLAFAVLTGTFFGYYPALKASKLTPIEALNHE